MKDMILYHGSRGGIEGNIKPCSRLKCDFGRGFYMGDNPQQVKGLVVEDFDPVFYTLKFKLSEIPEDKILILNDNEWLNMVLACRKKVPEYSALNVAKKALKELEKYDVVIGPIADDRMNEAMQEFSNGALTDNGLRACLQSINYGNQIIARTNFACSKIEIISKRELIEKEAEEARKYSYAKRLESREVVKQMMIKYRRNGLYIDEIIHNQQIKNNNFDMEEIINESR